MLTWNHLINQWVLFGYLLSGSLHGDVVSACELIDFKKDLKVALSSVGKMYIVQGILTNSLTCMYRNSTSTYFGFAH